MTRNKLIKELKERISKATELSLVDLKITGYNKEENRVREILVSINYGDSGMNVAYKVKDAIDEFVDEYGIDFNRIYLDL